MLSEANLSGGPAPDLRHASPRTAVQRPSVVDSSAIAVKSMGDLMLSRENQFERDSS